MDRDRLLFAKEGRARFISHLDLMRTFQRAFIRADVPIKNTEGFNPHPFVSIILPLSVGFASRCEILEFVLLPGVARQDVPERLNAVLPEGVRVLACYHGQTAAKELVWLDYRLDITFAGDKKRLTERWSELLGRDSWIVEKKSKKAKTGVTSVDIASLVKGFSFTEAETGIVLDVRLLAQNPGLNPQVLMAALLEETPGEAPERVDYCRVEVFAKDGSVFR